MFKDEVRRLGKEDLYDADSAATSSEEIGNGIGNPVYPPAKRMLARHGISCEGKRARLLKKEDYAHYDLIIGMDGYNMADLRRLVFPDDRPKLRKLLTYAGLDRDVADPWYTGNFEETYADVILGCTHLLESLEKEKTL